ncbi:maleate isomerase [Sulfobacillus thermosulfidooxidans DSM 9293]|uniref:Maleate isomerase n=2 Tax=Sulfobacillus thermosulfidooxidans TaxID=28034 RepID=A0A1W1WHJ2_SULTA|nr:hypothetical protein [Sulfobacillus thermosulfidooxidans]PSR24993.1 MAG: hypothetical protein C7B47_13355 [Sulfobacillus thermosulfidooxidans]SMC05778.1 maleate isomerase [Sulfobacillus thermosulfidooxidans DSM 9293]
MIKILVLRSSENTTLFSDLCTAYPNIEWVDIVMPFLPGRGESIEERTKLLKTVKELIQPFKNWDVIFYARAYGAFSPSGRSALHQTVGGPIVTAPGSVLEFGTEHQWTSWFILTPYGQSRHDFEVQWAMSHGLQVDASACLGYDNGVDIARLTVEDLIPAVLTGNRSPADGIYLACTITRTIIMGNDLRKHTTKSFVSATDAMLWSLQQKYHIR